MRQKKEIDSTLREIEDIFVDEMIKKRKALKIFPFFVEIN